MKIVDQDKMKQPASKLVPKEKEGTTLRNQHILQQTHWMNDLPYPYYQLMHRTKQAVTQHKTGVTLYNGKKLKNLSTILHS